MSSVFETIKQHLSIDQVIGSYIKLEPSGRNWKAKCPFHNEKTASLNITTDSGLYYCFGCHKGGDIFQFVQDIEHIDKGEALEKLADRAGIDISSFKKSSPQFDQNKRLTNLLFEASRFYHGELRKNKTVVDYLLGRGLTKETMITFMIGYSPDYTGVITHLKKLGFSETEIVNSGIGIAGDRGLFDRFSGRVMFPTQNQQGKTIAFSARLLPNDSREGKTGKYINSPETNVYHKSNVLFGYGLAKSSIIERGHALLVEGHMDVIMLHQYGFTETVGISGTACTREHMQLLSRITNHIMIAPDTDSAGLRALDTIALLAISAQLDVSVVLYTEKDPAESLQQNPDNWGMYMKQAVDYFDYCSSRLVQLSTMSEKLALCKTVIFPSIAVISQQVHSRIIREKIARSLGWNIDDFEKDYQQFLASLQNYIQPAVAPTSTVSPVTTLDQEELLLIEIVSGIDYITQYNDEQSEQLTSQLQSKIQTDHYEKIVEQRTGLPYRNFSNKYAALADTARVPYIKNLLLMYDALVLEKQYTSITQKLRSYESTAPDEHYGNLLMLGQQLLAQIHAIREQLR